MRGHGGHLLIRRSEWLAEPLLAPLAATVPDTSIVGFKLFSKRGLERRGHQRRQVDRDGQP